MCLPPVLGLRGPRLEGDEVLVVDGPSVMGLPVDFRTAVHLNRIPASVSRCLLCHLPHPPPRNVGC